MSGHHSHTALQETVFDEGRQNITRRVALIGMAVNIFLTIAQILGGIYTHSQALIADAIHTLSDVVGDIVVLFAAHHSGKEADEKHPYGHGRIETLATVVLGLLLGGVAIVIFLRAWDRLMGNSPITIPAPAAMLFAALALIAKEGLYQYAMKIATRLNSPMLKANAWHYRSDALSSVVVLLAIGGVQLGFPWLDAVGAVIIAAMIFYMAIQLLMESTKELVDTGLDVDEVQEITTYINGLQGVENLHFLRTRRMGGQVLADVHLQVDGRLSVSEGHYIGEAAMYKLRRRFPTITDIVVHIDPEDDEIGSPSRYLPSRAKLIEQLKAIPETAPVWQHIQHTTLHYIDGRISLEFVIEPSIDDTVLHTFEQAAASIPVIQKITFLRPVAL